MRELLVGGAVAVALAVSSSGCGSAPSVVTAGPAPASPYDGPMSVEVDHSDQAQVAARSGAAGRALECDGAAYQGGGADYDSGLESAQGTPEAAVENYFHEEGPSWGMPTDGYRIERRDDHRVLFSYDVGARTKAAVVVADSVDDWKHRTGWGVETWAGCDPSELPEDVTGAMGLDVWTDATGARVPVTVVTSWSGPEHCGWQDITFLEIGSEPTRFGGAEEYLRDTHGELADSLRGAYSPEARLPAQAEDSGWRHDGRELWRVSDRSAAYLVNVEDPTDVERWPASRRPIGCD